MHSHSQPTLYMHAIFVNDRLHLYPTTVQEFKDALWWEHLNSPVQAFVHRPVEVIQQYRAELTNQIINTNDNLLP